MIGARWSNVCRELFWKGNILRNRESEGEKKGDREKGSKKKKEREINMEYICALIPQAERNSYASQS